jgi:MYXO-CTERM domain-containing protein
MRNGARSLGRRLFLATRLAVVAPLLVAAAGAEAPARAEATAKVSAVVRDGQATPWLYVGRASIAASTPRDPFLRARAIVDALAPHASMIELRSADVAHFGDGDVIVRMEQAHLGLPVIGRGATVRMNAAGDSVVSTVSVETSLPSSITPRLSAADAAKAAQPRTRIGIDARDAHLVVFPVRGGAARLAYAVVPVVPAGLPTAPRIMIDAENGRILESRDMVVFLDQAKFYENNPITSPTLSTKALDLPTDGSGKLQNAFVQSQNCVDNKTVKAVNFGVNVNIHVCDLTQSSADASHDFLFDPIDDAANPESRKDKFSEVSMYHHTSKVYAFFRKLQGDDTAQITVDKPLRTISNLQLAHGLLAGDIASAGDGNIALDPLQNAFFSPAGAGLGAVFEQLYGFNAGAMWFGQGPTHDYSYDGDVVYHEFTHAVVDHTLKLQSWHLDKYGLFDAPGAMNEGLADYFSSALAGDPNVGEYASKDISATITSIRSLDNTDTCPSSILGEVHFDSTLFSGGLWKARMTLPEADRFKYDAAIYKAMRTYAGTGDLGYEDAANLFLATLKTDLPSGATAMTKELTARGVLPECPRILDGAKTVSAAPRSLFSPGAFAAPGTQNLPAGGAVAPGMLQVKLDLPAGTTTVHVSFSVAAPAAASPLGGGGGTPFTPVLLAKFGAPLSWTSGATLTSNADQTVTPKGDGAKTTQIYTGSVDVPAGASSIYVQIASSGSDDGTYNAIKLTTEGEAPVPDAGAGGGGEDAGTAAGATPTSDSGCSCRATSQGTTGAASAFALAALAAIGAVARRRTR